MKTKLLLCLALGLWFSFPPLAHSETVNISRRLVRFDGKPAAGATVRVLGDYGSGNEKTDFEVVAGADGVFSTDITQGDSLWVGHLIIRAEGCATLCEVGVTGRPKSAPLTPVRRLGAPFNIEGRTTDAEGRPVADAKVSLVLAQIQSWNETPLNSATMYLTTTPELIAHSNTNGFWSMMGIDFVLQDRSVPATAVFEAVADNPLRGSKVDLKLDPDPGSGSRKNVPLDFRLAPLIRVAGRVVNLVNGEPVTSVRCLRSEIFTTLTGSSALTDEDGRFELEIPGPLPILWFQLYRDGYAETTVKTAMREQATSDWGTQTISSLPSVRWSPSPARCLTRLGSHRMNRWKSPPTMMKKSMRHGIRNVTARELNQKWALMVRSRRSYRLDLSPWFFSLRHSRWVQDGVSERLQRTIACNNRLTSLLEE